MFDLGSVRAAAAALSGIGAGADDVERIDLIRALEELKCAVEGAQAVLTAAFDASQRAAEAAAGVPAERRGRGVAAQVALARRESPHRGRQHVGLALVLRDELPATLAALRAGRIGEWRATIIARETACLSRADRAEVDHVVADDLEVLESLSDGEVVGRCREVAYELDPVSFVERRGRRAEADRRVTLRPAPEVMAQLSALVPVRDGVAVWAVLSREAEALKAAGDDRSRGQIMADTLVHRVLGTQDASETSPPGLLVNVVVEDAVLLGDKDGFGWVEHYGEVPGDLLRDWLATHAETGVEAWVRRLYVAPKAGELVAMDSQARRFEGKLAEFLRLRDRRCRTPYCDAPIRHLDHAHDHAAGGATSVVNGQGLCQACNHAKQARGWTARPRPGPRHTIETTTPTGHRYTSVARALRASARGLRIDLVLGA
jgi:hypothetical protein